MRPILLFVCHPLTGHVTPVLRIAGALRQRGWHVAFLSSKFFRPRIEAAGLQFLPLLGTADLDDSKLFDRSGGSGQTEGLGSVRIEDLPQSITDLRHQTLEALPAEWDSIKAALVTLAEQCPGERMMLVSEAFFYGSMPLKFGAPLPPSVSAALLSRTVCLSITAPCIRSVDLPPFGLRESFDSSAAGHERNGKLWDEWMVWASPLTALLRRKMYVAGATVDSRVDDIVYLGGTNYTCHDAIAQIGVPEFEFPRSDFPRGFRFAGIIPPSIPATAPKFPWWDDLLLNGQKSCEERARVVVVAQGTVEMDPTELILPTLQLLADRQDVLTVAILGSRTARLPDKIELPRNACVANYLSYDAVLPFADLWVHNGGYGATMHGIAHGVPMVIAGDGQDKPENGKRVQFSGLGIDLATAHPSAERLGTAINEVLSGAKYAKVARSMQQTFKQTDCFTNIEEIISKEAECSA